MAARSHLLGGEKAIFNLMQRFSVTLKCLFLVSDSVLFYLLAKFAASRAGITRGVFYQVSNYSILETILIYSLGHKYLFAAYKS